MEVSVFISAWSDDEFCLDTQTYYLSEPIDYLKEVNSVKAVEQYLPTTEEVPKVNDAPSAAIIIQVDMDSADTAQALVASDKFKDLFLNENNSIANVNKINLEIFTIVDFPIPGQSSPAPRTAGLSLVVRYYGPVANQTEFIDYYTKNHPPILAQFEDVRNVRCYLPLDWDEGKEILDDSIIHGNEIVFDNAADLTRALESEVRTPLTADLNKFAPFGYNSLHPMDRKMVYKREAG